MHSVTVVGIQAPVLGILGSLTVGAPLVGFWSGRPSCDGSKDIGRTCLIVCLLLMPFVCETIADHPGHGFCYTGHAYQHSLARDLEYQGL